MSKQVTIIDYGSGNLLSVCRAIEHAGGVPIVTSSSEEITKAERLILPGVGAFADGMKALQEFKLSGPIQKFVKTGRPFLGICLGMQMLADSSEEFGEGKGLGIISGRVVPIPKIDVHGMSLKSPHIGWSELSPVQGMSWHGTIFQDIPQNTSVYLVHSYHMVPDKPEHYIAYYDYGGHQIVSAIQSDNIIGCQFHPEKSGPSGINILKSFLRL